MNSERYLNQIKKLDELIDAKIAERNRVWSIATNVNSKTSDGMPHAKGNVSDPVGVGAIRLYIVERELDDLIDRYVDYKQEVVKTLEKLPDKEYGVLHRYYIRNMTLEQIAEDMGYCERQISRIKKDALQYMEDVLECQPIK